MVPPHAAASSRALPSCPAIPHLFMKSLLVSLLCHAVWGVTGESDVTSKHGTVEAKVGDDIVLHCYKEPPYDLKALRLEWTHNEKEVHLYRKGKDELENQDKNFTGRTSVFHDEIANGNISLRLSPVEDRDVGNYICLVKVKDSPQVTQCNLLLRIVPEPGAGKVHINYGYFGFAILLIGIPGIVYLIWKRCETTRNLTQGVGGGAADWTETRTSRLLNEQRD